MSPGASSQGVRIWARLAASPLSGPAGLVVVERQRDADRVTVAGGGLDRVEGARVRLDHDRLLHAEIAEDRARPFRRPGPGGDGLTDPRQLGFELPVRRHPVQERVHVGLVERGRDGDQVAHMAGHQFAVAHEGRDPVPGLETAAGREPARHGGVVVGDHRRQLAPPAGFQHAPVVGESGERDLARLRFDARPFDREPMAIEAQRSRQGEVALDAVVDVVGVAGGLLELGGPQVLQHPDVACDVAALDLIGGARRPPEEPLRPYRLGARRAGAGQQHPAGD